ncbi:MAG: glycosyltransferase family 2 protein [Desulforhopalus sp.]
MLFYVYLGYPVCLWILSRLIPKKVQKAAGEPLVSILIAAYNEQEHIGQTIVNKLELDYPQDKLEVIVVSDDSTDDTDRIVKSFHTRNVKLLRQKPRAGKTSALNMAVPRASGDILVFSDANSIYAPDALRHIVANFHDPRVGYVTGRMIYANPGETPVGEGISAYMKYENFLRSCESQLGSLVGVDGGIDAMRRSIYSELNPDQLPDFVQPFKVTEKGYRVVYEPEALLRESSLSASDDEYRMRIRVSLRALHGLKDMSQLLWGSSGFLFAWQVWSHKVLRYLCFLFLLGAYIANTFLWPESVFYKSVLGLQTACYMGAFLSLLLERKNHKVNVLYLFHYFVVLNVAAGHAFIKFLAGRKQVLWTPRKG